MSDKYDAVWVSYSSISDFQQCPRAYYLKNIYKNPETGNKIQLATPALSLGQSVHEVIESLSVLPAEKRFKEPLLKKFDQAWKKVSDKIGGFFDDKTEQRFKKLGEEMLQKVIKSPGPVGELAIKIKEDLPNYWLSEEDNIILCGKVDWLQYLPDENEVRVLDFKTGKNREKSDSLQLPIYLLLVTNTQQRTVAGMSYWYLRLAEQPEEVELPSLEDAHQQILTIAKEISLARKLERFRCPQGENGCVYCRPLERIISGEAELVGENKNFKKDIFAFPDLPADEDSSYIV